MKRSLFAAIVAALSVGSAAAQPGLYTINLATGQASLVGAIGSSNVFGLAIAPGGTGSAYSIGQAGLSLISYNLATPGVVTEVAFSGAATDLAGIDFRPSNGLLYGYGFNDEIVTIDPLTGATTLVSNPSPNVDAANSNGVGIDFNPVPDALRVVDTDRTNLRVPNGGAGTAVLDGQLTYTGGTDNAGLFAVNPDATPFVADVAYTNNVAGATTTTIYYIDAANGVLATAAAPNSGVLSTVGFLNIPGIAPGTLDPTFIGFDIQTLSLNGGTADFAFAVFEASPLVVPVPAGVVVALAGVATLAGLRRRVA